MSGYINEEGKYVKGEDKPLPHDVSPLYKQYTHDDQKRRHAGDIVQPFVDGKPNREFVQIYKDDNVRDYFNQAQIDTAERDLGGL